MSKFPADFKPLLYRRYVDDCFLLFKSTDQIPQFLDFLNRQHPNIKFTCEIESNSTLPFLDISIIRKNGVFETSVYQKPTFTGLFTNFNSFIPSQYKCNLIPSLVHRLYNICSNYENFQAQLESLRQILNRNSYPTRLFDSCVRTFLDRVSQPKPLFILFLRKSCISLCRIRANILFKFAPKSPVCALLLIPISISDSCFARLYACLIFSPSKTKFPKP